MGAVHWPFGMMVSGSAGTEGWTESGKSVPPAEDDTARMESPAGRKRKKLITLSLPPTLSRRYVLALGVPPVASMGR